ncbi:hypothetical protein RCL1_007348 [Eukaryota sp. TZLM3-RCL]
MDDLTLIGDLEKMKAAMSVFGTLANSVGLSLNAKKCICIFQGDNSNFQYVDVPSINFQNQAVKLLGSYSGCPSAVQQLLDKQMTNLTLLPRIHQKLLTNSFEVTTLINSFEHGVELDFSNHYDNVNLAFYSHCSRLMSLNLSRKGVDNIVEISKFTNLETLDLSNVKLGYNTYGAVRVTDISFLSSCINLKSLSLDGSEVADLSPLSLLVELECLSLKATKVLDFWPLNNLTKLSSVDLRETLVPRKFQRVITNSSDIKVIINS